MDGLFSRYRNLSALLLLVAGQLILLAWQIKSNGETRLIRVWAVTAVTPLARGMELARDGAGGVLQRWFLSGMLVRDNAELKRQVEQLRIKNDLLQEQMQQAGRAQALLEFRSTIPSRSLPARILGSAPGVQPGVFILDQGTMAGVKRGMAVVTGNGIVGQVVAAYPTASLMMLATSQGFAAGVIGQKHHTPGLLKGEGGGCRVEGIRNEQPLDQGEWLYTSGDDRIFPRGLRVAQVQSVKQGPEGKEIEAHPAALNADFAEVLILLDAVHGQIPDPATPPDPGMQVAAPPPQDPDAAAAGTASPATPTGSPTNLNTDADRLREHYKRVVDAQGIKVGSTPYRAPDFNLKPAPPAPAAAPSQGAAGDPAASESTPQATAPQSQPAPKKPAAQPGATPAAPKAKPPAQDR
jgi:rod shape-determining protein MreC